jgi:hypothetical protein
MYFEYFNWIWKYFFVDFKSAWKVLFLHYFIPLRSTFRVLNIFVFCISLSTLKYLHWSIAQYFGSTSEVLGKFWNSTKNEICLTKVQLWKYMFPSKTAFGRSVFLFFTLDLVGVGEKILKKYLSLTSQESKKRGHFY